MIIIQIYFETKHFLIISKTWLPVFANAHLLVIMIRYISVWRAPKSCSEYTSTQHTRAGRNIQPTVKRYISVWRAPKSWSEYPMTQNTRAGRNIQPTSRSEKLLNYYLPVCYLLRIPQYPVNTTYNIVTKWPGGQFSPRPHLLVSSWTKTEKCHEKICLTRQVYNLFQDLWNWF